MTYTWKPTPEIIWFVLTAIVGALTAAVTSQGATPPTDWHAWAIGAAAAAVRAVLGVLLSVMGPKTGGS